MISCSPAPTPSQAQFLKQAWYMAAWKDEVRAETPLARTLLGQHLVLFRDEQGQVSALLDRCPHRFAPLSAGYLENGVVACRYHGLAFNSSGACVKNPHGPITGALSVPVFPVREVGHCIWIWMGDPAAAEGTDVPDVSFLNAAPKTAFSKGYLHCKGHYLLFVDNLLDLSHVDYLHSPEPGEGAYSRSDCSVRQTNDGVSVTWQAVGEVPTPLMRARGSNSDDRIDFWTEVSWICPAVLTLKSGRAPAGSDPATQLGMLNAHFLTPETEETTHYFFASTRNFDLDNSCLNDEIAAAREHIFSTEDGPMIAGQQDRIGARDLLEMKPALMKIDEASTRMRRSIAARLSAEMAESHLIDAR